jgi:hypothetical protein
MNTLPKFIAIMPTVSIETVVNAYPNFSECFTNFITNDTVIVVDGNTKLARVNTLEGQNQGILHVNEYELEFILRELKVMLACYKEGASVKDAANIFVRRLTEPTPGELHVKEFQI